MNYEKGTFLVIPNKDALRGKPSEMQAIYFWICEHADDNGQCFPSRRTLAKEAGCNVKTVDKYLHELEVCLLVKKVSREKKGSPEKMSNIYQVLILARGVPKTGLPGTENGATPSTENGSVTVSSINSIHITDIQELGTPPVVFDFEKELGKLQNSSKKHLKIVALYWFKKGWKFDNQIQCMEALKRDSVPAWRLRGYSGTEISAAIDYCSKFENWSLYAVGKYISDIINHK